MPAGTLAPLRAVPSRGWWPIEYRQAPEDVREAYRYAVAHRSELLYIPCYCGCGVHSGHRDNYDCYVKAETAPGQFQLDPHGFG